MQHPKLEELARQDPRYPAEAYEFLYAALAHTLEMLGHKGETHVAGRQLMLGVRDLALREFGLMARGVFRTWGVEKTDDFGEMVFNLIDAGLMQKTDSDSRADFHAVFDLDEALTRDYRIELPCEASEEA